MKLSTLAIALLGLSTVAVPAAASTSADRILGLGETVAALESRYPGKVVAIELDAAGDRRAHYHVDMLFPVGGLARVDVDAATLAIAGRDPAPLAPDAATLSEATARVEAAVPGEIVVAVLDSTNRITPHYDIDVRLPQGALARFKVDPVTRAIGWRTPAILAD